jgi:hypothetical protein
MKKWFLERFLPMWAKETVYADNRRLMKDNHRLTQCIKEQDAYIKGLEIGIRAMKKIVIHTGETN